MKQKLTEESKSEILIKTRHLFNGIPFEAYFVTPKRGRVVFVVEWMDGKNAPYILGRLEELLKEYPIKVRVSRTISERLIDEVTCAHRHSFIGSLLHTIANKHYEEGDYRKFVHPEFHI